ncbi:MAG: M48 family metallopeptidase [Fibrobacteria bacterium]|nr:M48 family metallopeptidase [Fibrobacteria bacterium]
MTSKKVHRVKYGTTVIKYQINRRDRKTLAIHVHPDGSVETDAPKKASLKAIAAKVSNRAAWIQKQQRQFASYPSPLPERQYISGEGYRYLGRQYRLKVVKGKTDTVKLPRGFLQVESKNCKSSAHICRIVEKWQLSRSRKIFNEAILKLRPKAKSLKLPEPKQLILRTMKTRWGSCSKSGNLTLNPELLAAPRECIEYVVAHELCHLMAPNHTRKFYNKLDEFVPNWKKLRERLNRTVELKTI